MIARTFNGGHVALGSELSITNGVTREVRAAIVAREEQDKIRRKGYRKENKPRIGSKRDTFKDYTPPAYLV